MTMLGQGRRIRTILIEDGQKIIITDGVTDVVVDPLGYIVTVEIEHYKVHIGDFYTVSDYDNNVLVAAPKYWLVRTPNTALRFHTKINVETDTGTLLEFFENPTITLDGVALTAFNNERNSAKTCSLNFFRDPTVGADGTRIQVARVAPGREKKIGGTARSAAEWILKQNEEYLVKATVDANGAEVTINIEGYEV